MPTMTFFEWVQLLSSCGIFTGGGAMFAYVLRTDRRITVIETSFKNHLEYHRK